MTLGVADWFTGLRGTGRDGPATRGEGEAVARYRIAPERSWVEIHARSSVHPIHARTDGLEGHLDLEVLGAGRVNLGSKPTGQLSLRVERLSSGNPLEDRELKRRIDEASRYVPIEQLCLSSQCGFSSGIGGNAMTSDDEIAKLRLVVETAREVWG